ncbi:MAG: hypothetical protein ACT4P0_11400 [Panacagrimonas sp.]
MVNWMIAGALAAVLIAELADVWAISHLVRRCRNIHPSNEGEMRTVRWYAEGFDHSRAISEWLRASCVALAVLSLLFGAHPLVILASLLLAVAAHGECRFSVLMRRRFFRRHALVR